VIVRSPEGFPLPARTEATITVRSLVVIVRSLNDSLTVAL
jgi:hypothetical protein